jgi:hypothetical protein
MPRDVLQANLTQAQQAYIDLLSGAKGESYSYTQGDGTKSVTYTRANIEALAALIQTLQSQLGVVSRARRPMRFRYR